MNQHDVEERLFVDRHGRHNFNEVFWCHMGRYLHALGTASVLARQLRRPLRVLDVACGTGYGSYFLSRGGHNCCLIQTCCVAL